jgi:hypothetical protein
MCLPDMAGQQRATVALACSDLAGCESHMLRKAAMTAGSQCTESPGVAHNCSNERVAIPPAKDRYIANQVYSADKPLYALYVLTCFYELSHEHLGD